MSKEKKLLRGILEPKQAQQALDTLAAAAETSCSARLDLDTDVMGMHEH